MAGEGGESLKDLEQDPPKNLEDWPDGPSFVSGPSS